MSMKQAMSKNYNPKEKSLRLPRKLFFALESYFSKSARYNSSFDCFPFNFLYALIASTSKSMRSP